MPQKIALNRYMSLFKRTWKDIELLFVCTIFSFKHLNKNRFSNLFLFRKAIETDQVSPFRKLFVGFKTPELVPLTLPQFGNISIVFNLNDNFQMAICKEFVKYKIYDMGLIDFIPDFSFDCGSYRGYFTFLIDKQFANCKKLCIEPHPENYRILLKTIEENAIKNIEVINKAISKSMDTVELELWGSNMSLNHNTQEGELDLVHVETMSLFELLTGPYPEKKIVLKVDIEGSELDFFPECISMLPNCCAVYLETHDGWNTLHSIQEEFEECGFRFSVLRDRGLYIDSFAIRNDDLLSTN